MKRSLLFGLLVLVLTGCGTMGNLAPGMDVFSIRNEQLDREPPDADDVQQWRENLRSQPPGVTKPERVHGGIV